MTHSPAGGFLSGTVVVDFGQYVAGPGVGLVLAQLGADVIKIEPVTGELGRQGGRPFIPEFNRGKRSLALDLRDTRGIAVAHDLVARADVLVENMRPGVMDRLGLGHAQVNELNERLVYVAVSGFGRGAAFRDRGGFDTAAQAESGLMAINGSPDGPPEFVGASIIDVVTAHLAAQGTLAALFSRERTGRGAFIDTSLLQAAISLQECGWAEYFHTGRGPIKGGLISMAPASEAILTRDGCVVVSASAQHHWVKLCEALDLSAIVEDPRFVDSPTRVKNRPAMLDYLSAEIGKRTTDEVMSLLLSRGIVVAKVRDYDDVRKSAAAQESGIFGTAQSADGSLYEALNLPYRMNGECSPVLTGVDDIGGHSREILRELGRSDAEIEELVAQGVVGTADQDA